jgi:hypothetical protein
MFIYTRPLAESFARLVYSMRLDEHNREKLNVKKRKVLNRIKYA